MPFQAPLTLGGLSKPNAQQTAGLATPAGKLEDWTQICVKHEIRLNTVSI